MIPSCLTISNIRYASRVKWSYPVKGVMPSPAHWCSTYWKGSLLVTLDYGHQLYFIIITEFKPVKLCLKKKLTLCHILPERRGWKKKGGVCGVMVIVVGNGHGDMSSKPGRDWLHFHIALISLGKVWIHLFSLQQWVNSWTDWVLQPWWGN